MIKYDHVNEKLDLILRMGYLIDIYSKDNYSFLIYAFACCGILWIVLLIAFLLPL